MYGPVGSSELDNRKLPDDDRSPTLHGFGDLCREFSALGFVVLASYPSIVATNCSLILIYIFLSLLQLRVRTK